MGLAAIKHSGDERDRLPGCDDKPVRRRGEFHGRDWARERETGCELPRAQIPPPGRKEAGERDAANCVAAKRWILVHSLHPAVLAGGHASVVADPDDALDRALVRSGSTAIREHVWLCIGAAEIEHAHFLFLATGEEVGRVRGDGDGADDVIVGEGVEGLAGVGIPDLANRSALWFSTRASAQKQR